MRELVPGTRAVMEDLRRAYDFFAVDSNGALEILLDILEANA